MAEQADGIRLESIRFPDEARVVREEACGKSFAFYSTHVDVQVSGEGDYTRYLMRVSNRGLAQHPLKIRFSTGRRLAYVPTWLHNPPVYDLRGAGLSFTHFGLPKRSGVGEAAIPADLPLAICFDPGTNPACEMVACETVEKGVGLRLEDGGITFCFLDGTERSSWAIEFHTVRGTGLIDCLRNYHRHVPYDGIRANDAQMMWFYDDLANYGNADGSYNLQEFQDDAATMKELGVKYVVIEPGHLSQHFDKRFWSPGMARHHPRMDFFVKSLDVLTDSGMAPLIYTNCVHGKVDLMTDPDYGTPDLHRLRYRAADGGLEQSRMQESMKIDMNWFKDGVVPTTEYPMDSDPVMEVRCAEWRDWLCRRITYMLGTYPQLAGTYVDTWPAGLPLFGESLTPYDDAYDGNSWWNAVNDLMWDIRQVTRSFEGKVLMLNDSRMPKKVMEAADIILNEDAGSIANPERAFWHCLRSMAVGHGSKPGYQFHHAKPGMRNDVRARTVMACAAAMGLGYCAIHFDHRHREDIGDTKEAYNAAVRDMKWIAEERAVGTPEITMSGETRNIESLVYSTDGHEVEIDFPAKDVSVRRTGG